MRILSTCQQGFQGQVIIALIKAFSILNQIKNHLNIGLTSIKNRAKKFISETYLCQQLEHIAHSIKALRHLIN